MITKLRLRIFFITPFAGIFFVLVFLNSCNSSLPEYLRLNPSSQKKFNHLDTLKGTNGPGRNCYDVLFYDLSVDVDVSNRYIRGEVKMVFNLLWQVDTIQVDLYENMKVDFITDEKSALRFSRDKGRILIAAEKFEAGKVHTLRIHYEGKPIAAVKPPWVGGFVWKHDSDGFPHIGVVCEGLGSSFWWPCKDFYGDKPDSMMIRITAPSDLIAVSNGKLNQKEIIDGNKTQWNWCVSNPISTGSITLNLGNFALLQDTMQYSGTTRMLNYYVLPRNYEKAKIHFAQAKRILRVYESLFGRYPFWEDGYKLIETPYVGMENQTAISYGNGYSNTKNYFTFGIADYIILHETAHEWWGNSLTACDPSENWLHEGFATYAEGLFIEKMLGYPKLIEFLAQKREGIKNKRPLVGPHGVNYWNWRDEDSYSKGALILHTLRKAIGDDEKFFLILKTFASRYEKKIICTEDFISTVNEVTGKDFRNFFDQYLFRKQPPLLEYYYDGKKLYYRWANTNLNFEMPVDFRTGIVKVRVTPSFELKSCDLGRSFNVLPDDSEFFIEKKVNPYLKELNGYSMNSEKP